MLAASPGPDVLDVGIGTGISARPFQAAGCRVLGVEVDARMAEFAREHGCTVEVAKFEEWDGGDRTFDVIVAGMTWHWIDPVAGARKAAALLRPRGLLAAFWNVGQPPPRLAGAFSQVYRRVLPDAPFAWSPRNPLDAYERILTSTLEGIRDAGAFGEPRRWRFDWERSYTADEWMDLVPTFGGHSDFPPGKLRDLQTGVGAAVDAVGGAFTMRYAAVALTAHREPGRAGDARRRATCYAPASTPRRLPPSRPDVSSSRGTRSGARGRSSR